MKKILSIFIGTLFISLMAGAQISPVWKDARFLKEPMKKIMVVSQFADPVYRQMAQDMLWSALTDKGYSAIPAYDIFAYDSMFLYSTMERKLDSAGVDGILIIKMIDAENTDLNIAPGDVIPPYAYNYYEYYSVFYYYDLPLISNANYYRKPGKKFRIDIYLYQNRGDMIVWGGQSNFVDPLNPEKAIKGISKKIVKNLRSEELISVSE